MTAEPGANPSWTTLVRNLPCAAMSMVWSYEARCGVHLSCNEGDGSLDAGRFVDELDVKVLLFEIPELLRKLARQVNDLVEPTNHDSEVSRRVRRCWSSARRR